MYGEREIPKFKNPPSCEFVCVYVFVCVILKEGKKERGVREGERVRDTDCDCPMP